MTKIKSTAEIYSVLENAMDKLDKPITAASLMDRPDVRASALERFGTDVQIATNKLSDMLGFMWRRGVLERYPSDDPRTTARFAYAWKQKVVPELKPIQNATTKSGVGNIVRVTENDDGSINIDFDKFSMVIRPK